MSSHQSRPRDCFVPLAIALLAPAAVAAQETVSLVGIVRLADRPDAGDVLVHGRYPGAPPDGRSPAREIYVYTVPSTERNVVLTFGRPGYDLQALRVEVERGRFAIRVADILLTSTNSTPLDGAAPPGDDGDEIPQERRLRAHLESQAAIAQRAGRAFVEVFRWNLAEYRYRLARSPTLAGELEAFSRDERFEAIASPVRNRQIEAYGRMIEARETGRTSLAPVAALDFARDSDGQWPAPVRASAIRAMLTMSLSDEHRNALLGLLRRNTEVSRSPALLSSSFEGLAKLGTDVDRARVLRSTQSSDVDRVRAAITAIGRTKIANEDSVVENVIRNNPNAAVRAVIIEDVGQRIAAGAAPGAAPTRAVADALTRDTAAVVRMRAVQTLGTIRAADSSSTVARRALEAAAADSTRVDIRRAARATLRRPPR